MNIAVLFRWLLVSGLISVMAGCSTVAYYSQAIQGQWQILSNRVPVADLVSDDEVAAPLRERLALSQQMLEFAEDRLGLSAEGRYRAYVDLKRQAVVWNIVAAPAHSLVARQWCYPVVGCAPYRGYFSAEKASSYARSLEAEGFDVYIGEVPAYSTLGWFDDPLLNTFINWSPAYLARLLFHELSHSRIWVNSDVGFNEAFASFVGEQGVIEYLQAKGANEELQAYQLAERQSRAFREFLAAAKNHLLHTYDQAARAQQGAAQGKAAAYAQIDACYQTHREQFGGTRYDVVMQKLNNAYFVAVGTYQDWVPAFAQLFRQAQGDWSRFYILVEELAELDFEAREAALQELVAQLSAEHPENAGGDDDNTHQVHCEAFANHALNAQVSAGENNQVGWGGHR